MPLLDFHANTSRALLHTRLFGEIEEVARAGSIAAAFSRSAEDAGTDSEGNSYTVDEEQPLFVDTSRGIGLLMDSAAGAAKLVLDWQYPIDRSWSALLELVVASERDPRVVLVVGADDESDTTVRVEHTGTQWRAQLESNGSGATSNATMSLTAGDRVRVRLKYEVTGGSATVQVSATKNDGTEVVGTTSGSLSVSSWGDTAVRLNDPTTVVPTATAAVYRRLVFSPDPDATLEELLSLV